MGRGKELTETQKAVVIDRVVAQRQPLRQLENEIGIKRSTAYNVVKHAYKRKRDEIENEGLLVTEQDQNEWGTMDLIEPRYLAAGKRSGQPRALSEDEIDYLCSYATESKVQRLSTWDVIAWECGYGHIAHATIWSYFRERGYIRAVLKKKPLLSAKNKRDRVTVCNHLKQSLRTGCDVIIAVDECKCTAGIEGSHQVTRNREELWHTDSVDPGIDDRTGLLFFGIIGRGFRGKCYIFDPEDPKDRQRVLDDYQAEMQPKLDVLLAQYELDLAEYEWLQLCKKNALTPGDKRDMLTGKKPRKPTMAMFSFRSAGKGGVDWYRYLHEIIEPTLGLEIDRFVEEKDPYYPPLLIQDGASPHAKCVKKGAFCKLNCQLLKWPGNSPDLNLIEHIWAWMRQYISKEYGFLEAGQVRSVWRETWLTVPLEYINWAMDHLVVVVERCLAQNGDNKYNG